MYKSQLKKLLHSRYVFLCILFLVLSPVLLWSQVEDHGSMGHDLINNIGLSILAATVLAFLAHYAKQPMLLAYILAGVIIGPQIGFGWVNDQSNIKLISEIGLILLLFMIGLEIDIKKLRQSGKALILSGVWQFIISAVLGLMFFALLGYTIHGGKYDLFYLAVCCAMSSTAIVVKLLYAKSELDTVAGRITLGILVFQDIWAIVILGLQPNLADPQLFEILWSFIKGGLLVLIAFLIGKYLLPRLFESIAKVPELVLVASLGWCFLICGLASFLGLSMEMGALIAGIAISTFPYNLDVIAKVISIRDFFMALFFVALGMTIPNPMSNPGILIFAFAAAVFIFISRIISVYPILYALKQGHRISLLPSINLANMSEFSLVIATLGYTAGHINQNVLTLIIFTFVITSILTPYFIKYSDPLQKSLAKMFIGVGLKDFTFTPENNVIGEQKDIAILGFFKTASSLIAELRMDHLSTVDQGIMSKLVVVDFNPNIHERLSNIGVKAIYGDVSHIDTLQHSGIEDVHVVVSTIPDSLLVGTNNLTLVKQMQQLCPNARIIVTAESIQDALDMYNAGADYVLLPRVLTAQHLKEILPSVQRGRNDQIKQKHITLLRGRQEILE